MNAVERISVVGAIFNIGIYYDLPILILRLKGLNIVKLDS